jgi:hypothetical protein
MNTRCFVFGALFTTVVALADRQSLFDGKTLAHWEGNTNVWRVESGLLVGGDGKTSLKNNEFLASQGEFGDFVLTLKFRLEGTEGFVNSGVQFRSQRVPNDPEMIGYQADIGDGWYGCLYDESRRNIVLARPTDEILKKALHPLGQWNDYEVRCEGRHIVIRLNGAVTVDYTESDPKIPVRGHLGLQVHGGGKTRVSFKDIEIETHPAK